MSFSKPSVIFTRTKKTNDVFKTYNLKDIYNFDETALFYKQAQNLFTSRRGRGWKRELSVRQWSRGDYL